MSQGKNISIRGSAEFHQLAQEMAQTVGFLAARGWTPATSSNFSARLPGYAGHYMMSRSGIHKERFTADDLMVVDRLGTAVEPATERPSAEARLHLALYEDPQVGAVLHTHSVNSTVLSRRYQAQRQLVFSGYEILKGLAGHSSHEVTEVLPVFANSQEMPELGCAVREYRRTHDNLHGFLLGGHGLYCWGADILSAKRHVEVFEFLFECLMK